MQEASRNWSVTTESGTLPYKVNDMSQVSSFPLLIFQVKLFEHIDFGLVQLGIKAVLNFIKFEMMRTVFSESG